MESINSSSGRSTASTKVITNWYACICSIICCLTSVLPGYGIGVMSGALIYIKEDLKIDNVQYEVLGGIINFYSLIGSFIAGKTADSLGRRCTLILAGVIVCVGSIVMAFAPNYAWLMFGRFITGIGNGFAFAIVPVYIAELAPASIRGLFSSLLDVSVNVGILISYIANFAFAGLPSNVSWRWMIGLGSLLAVVVVILSLIFMEESPRWLVMKGRISEAKRVLDKTAESPEEAERYLDQIKAVVGISTAKKAVEDHEAPLLDSHSKRGDRGEVNSGLWKEFFYGSGSVRRILLTVLGIQFFQQASGIDSIVLYSPRVLAKAGIRSDQSRLATIVGVGLTKTSFILLAAVLLDRVGRRPLLLISAGGTAISAAILGLGLMVVTADVHLSIEKWVMGVCIAAIFAYVGFFSSGFGPIAWVYSTEILPLRLRAEGVSLGVIMNRFICSIVSISFLSLSDAITDGGVFFLYGGITLIAWFFIYFCLPETNGKTLEEIETVFGYESPPCKSGNASSP